MLWDVWFAFDGWDYAAEEVVAGGVKLNRLPMHLEQAEMFAADHGRWAEVEYQRPGEVVLLNHLTGERWGAFPAAPARPEAEEYERREALQA
jgi:hypothetical protein